MLIKRLFRILNQINFSRILKKSTRTIPIWDPQRPIAKQKSFAIIILMHLMHLSIVLIDWIDILPTSSVAVAQITFKNYKVHLKAFLN